MPAFDIACLDTLTASQTGAAMPVVNLRTGIPYRLDDDKKTPVTITLLGRASDAYRAKQRVLQERRADRQARGIILSPEEVGQEDAELLTICTVGWTIEQLDGQPFPFSAANAALLWSDPRFVALRGRAIQFLIDDGNFLPISSAVS